MNMKEHILTALREQFNRWEERLASLSEEQITAPHFDSNWSIQDVIAHLWAWQQISIARMEAAVRDRDPEFPQWVAKLDKGWEENANQTNGRIYEIYHETPWSEVYQNWKEGFLRLLELGDPISEKDLLDGDRYPWLKGYPLAFILVASYDHHQEHLEKLLAWLHENRKIVRKASQEDIRGIRRVCAEGYRDTYAGLLSHETIERVIEEFYNLDRLRDEVTNPDGWNGWWVAEEDGVVLGAAGDGITKPGVGDLFVLYVDPAHQGRGIGTSLLNAVLEELKGQGAERVWVSVFDGNDRGIGFYKARGFEKRGKQPMHSSEPGEDYLSLRFCREL